MAEERIEEILSNASPCPFCGSTKLDISRKSNGHICVYCENCQTYGPRVLKYSLPDNIKPWPNIHYFKSLKDKKNNSGGDKYYPSFVKNDDTEIQYEWYYIEAVRRWNDRGETGYFIF